MKRTATFAAFAAFLAVSPMALAAESTPPASEAAGTNAGTAIQGQVEPNQVLAGNLKGATVFDDANKQIGTVKDIVIGSNGRVVAVVVNANNRNVAVSMQDLRIEKAAGGNDVQKVLLKIGEAQLNAAPNVELSGNAGEGNGVGATGAANGSAGGAASSSTAGGETNGAGSGPTTAPARNNR